MKIYLLFYDTDSGCSREEWNTFYTPCEVFDDEGKREERIKFITEQMSQNGNVCDYVFHKVDQEIMDNSMIQTWDK